MNRIELLQGRQIPVDKYKDTRRCSLLRESSPIPTVYALFERERRYLVTNDALKVETKVTKGRVVHRDRDKDSRKRERERRNKKIETRWGTTHFAHRQTLYV